MRGFKGDIKPRDLVLDDQYIVPFRIGKKIFNIPTVNAAVCSRIKQNAVLPAFIDLNNGVTASAGNRFDP